MLNDKNAAAERKAARRQARNAESAPVDAAYIALCNFIIGGIGQNPDAVAFDSDAERASNPNAEGRDA